MRRLVLCSTVFLAALPALAQPIAFPGAEGHGSLTRGGAGGGMAPKIIVVNTLADGIDSDLGVTTLREALIDPDPRIIVFEVGGYIDLQCQLSIFDPYVTIAGQTAPPPGITLRYDRLNILTHDVILQHLRFRIGDKPFGQADAYEFHGVFAGDTPNYNCPPDWDPVRPSGTEEIETHDLMLDHISVNWSVGMSIVLAHPDIHGVTLSNSILGEPLARNAHWKGPHAKAFMTGAPGMTDISILKNLFAHAADRNPKTSAGVETFVANNLVYSSWPPSLSGGTDPSRLSFQGNVIRPRSSLDPFWPSIGLGGTSVLEHALVVGPGVDPMTDICYVDNDCPTEDPATEDCALFDDGAYLIPPPSSFNLLTQTPCPLEPAELDLLASTAVFDYVTQNVGAFPDPTPANRPDATDARIVADTIAQTGKIVDCVEANRIDHVAGNIESATLDTVTFEANPFMVHEGTGPGYIGYRIEILYIDETGVLFEDRRIAHYDGPSRTATLDSPLPAQIGSGATYQVYATCANNVGGWPAVTPQTRVPVLPTAPGATGTSGYLVVEEWIHGFGEVPVVTYTTETASNEQFTVGWSTARSDGADLWATSRLEYAEQGTGNWISVPVSELPEFDHQVTVTGLPRRTYFEYRAIHDVFGVEHVAATGVVYTHPQGGGSPGS